MTFWQRLKYLFTNAEQTVETEVETVVDSVEELIDDDGDKTMAATATTADAAATEATEVAATTTVDVDVMQATLKAALVAFGYDIPEFDDLAALAKSKATS